MKLPNNNLQNEDNSDRWLVTFGDLLTLLLCFFLSIVAIDGERIRDKVSQKNSDISGTGIAKREGREIKKWLSFDQKEVEGGAFRATLKGKLSDHFKDQPLEFTRVILEICDRESGLGQEWNWHGATSQALAVRSQIVDAMPELDEEMLFLRVVGPNCQALSKASDSAVVLIGLESKIEI